MVRWNIQAPSPVIFVFGYECGTFSIGRSEVPWDLSSKMPASSLTRGCDPDPNRIDPGWPGVKL